MLQSTNLFLWFISKTSHFSLSSEFRPIVLLLYVFLLSSSCLSFFRISLQPHHIQVTSSPCLHLSCRDIAQSISGCVSCQVFCHPCAWRGKEPPKLSLRYLIFCWILTADRQNTLTTSFFSRCLSNSVACVVLSLLAMLCLRTSLWLQFPGLRADNTFPYPQLHMHEVSTYQMNLMHYSKYIFQYL